MTVNMLWPFSFVGRREKEGKGKDGGQGALNFPLPVPCIPCSRPLFLPHCAFAIAKYYAMLQNGSSCFSLLSSSHLEKPASCPLFSHLLWTSFPLYSQVPTTVHPPCTLGICFLPSPLPPPVDILPSLLRGSHPFPPYTLEISFPPSLLPPPVDVLPSLLPSSHHCPPHTLGIFFPPSHLPPPVDFLPSLLPSSHPSLPLCPQALDINRFPCSWIVISTVN